MKHDKLIYAVGCIILIAGTVMKILHLPYASSIVLFAFAGMSCYQAWHVTQLKKRIKELEAK